MHLYVTGRNFELTESIHDHVQHRIVQAVKGHASPHDVLRIEVQLYRLTDREARFGCHVLLQMPSQRDINIREEGTDLYAAIDLAEKRLLRSLVDQRERRLTLGRHPRKYTRSSKVLGRRATS